MMHKKPSCLINEGRQLITNLAKEAVECFESVNKNLRDCYGYFQG